MVSVIIAESKKLGFVAVGFTRPERPLFFDAFREWVGAGNHGQMSWIARHMDIRKNPGRLLEGCRAIIALAYPYASQKPATPDGFTAARYTEPKKTDYHDRLKRLCRTLINRVAKQAPGARWRVCVDSAPLLERSLAFASGLGFIGKNNMLIVPGHGSYVFLAEILTSAQLDFPESSPMESLCGDCTRCVDACPMGALEKPYNLVSYRCLSYLTVEYRGGIGEKAGRKMGNCFFGCDVCQEVCPFNPTETDTDICLPSAGQILQMEEEAFRQKFGRTAFARSGLEKIKNNLIALDRLSSYQKSNTAFLPNSKA